MNNAFYKISDYCSDKFLIDLEPNFFWSRRYEYPHIYSELQKQEPKKVLDAASGGYHPFKFKLAQDGCDTYACDLIALDYVSNRDSMRALNYELAKDDFDLVKFSIEDITNLSYKNKLFDAVVCISVIEHLPNVECVTKSLQEFKRILKDDGIIYLTIDYPNINPETLLVIAKNVGLECIGEYDYSMDEDCITSSYFGSQLWCFNMILKKVV